MDRTQAFPAFCVEQPALISIINHPCATTRTIAEILDSVPELSTACGLEMSSPCVEDTGQCFNHDKTRSGDNDLQASEAEASVFRFYVFSAYCKISKVHLDARHAI